MKGALRLFLVFLLVWVIARTAIYLLPGDPAEYLVHEALIQTDAGLLRQKMDIGASPWERMLSLPRAESLIRSGPTGPLVGTAVLRTLVLGLSSVALAFPLCFLLLLLDFRNPGGNRFSRWMSILLASAPLTVLGPVLLCLLPLPNPLLPAGVLALHLVAFWYRALSTRLRLVLPRSSVTGGRALGFGDFHVFWKHLLSPALGAFLVFFGGQIGTLLNGSLLVEVIFQWNGLGSLLAESVLSRDYPLVELTILIAAFLSLSAQQLGYAAQRWWDPTST